MINKVEIDGVLHIYVRYLSLSKYGNNGFNSHRAIQAVKENITAILTDFVPDVIHAHKLGFGSSIGACLKKMFHCPLIVTTHGGDLLEPLKYERHQNLVKWCNSVDTLVSVSSMLKKKALAIGIKNKMQVILNGHICADYVNWTRYKKYGITILQVSSLIKRKNVNITIESFACICRKYQDAHLYIVGVGAEEENLRYLCKKLEIENKVTFTGQISNDEVLSLMNIADFFIMPSVEEGFGIVYIEAMSQRCLTIGSKGEGIEDFIRNGENGFLVSPNDYLEIFKIIDSCLEDRIDTMKIVERGALEADSLTWNRNAEKYIELFQSLVKK